jgi:hypothetical protein
MFGIQAKYIFNEICRVYGINEFSFASVTRWCKLFKSGVDSGKMHLMHTVRKLQPRQKCLKK